MRKAVFSVFFQKFVVFSVSPRYFVVILSHKSKSVIFVSFGYTCHCSHPFNIITLFPFLLPRTIFPRLFINSTSFLDPYSPARLVAVTTAVAVIAFIVSVVALIGVEPRTRQPDPLAPADDNSAMAAGFRAALKQVWAEQEARRFTVFVFVSMLAYSAQDLILEPFAGTVFGMTPGESTRLSGVQHGGVLLGMILVAVSATLTGRGGAGALRLWTVGGCLASAAALVGIAVGGCLRCCAVA